MQSFPPIIQQYISIKSEYPDAILLYRVGDFYEAYMDDASVVAAFLNITLTRYNGRDDVPMCGIPHHAFDAYIPKLVTSGHSVAVCDQLETAEEAKAARGNKATILREVVRVITPGTLTEDNLIGSSLANWLCVLDASKSEAAIAFIDISTGEFMVRLVPIADAASIISVISPAEILVPDDTDIPELAGFRTRAKSRQMWRTENVSRFFGQGALNEFSPLELSSINAALEYISATQIGLKPKIKRPIKQIGAGAMQIDSFSVKNLEIFENISGSKDMSLFKVMDRTKTAGGRRNLRARMAEPLLDAIEINRRLDEVDRFYNDRPLMDSVRNILSRVGDVERIMGRISLNRAVPREYVMLAQSLDEIAVLREKLGSHGPNLQIARRILATIIEDAPASINDDFVRRGASRALDECKEIAEHGAKLIIALQTKYAQDTGISTLRIKYNGIFGYFIEVPAAKADVMLANHEFRHKQTLVNAVRFVSDELAEIERKILSAGAKKRALELSIFSDLRTEVEAASAEILDAAVFASEADVGSSLAFVALVNKYVRPNIGEGQDFYVKDGRHPVVEAALKPQGGTFIPNDADLRADSRIWLLTGPNMAGKSTFLRQNALLVIMAQMGSFVSASSLSLGVVDKLFSRVGASDNLAQGLSTFMVEMRETANILAQATSRSFVILDEIGRGTATFDGLSIAHAVLEHLDHDISCRGLFATHYHELNSSEFTSVSAHSMQVKEWKSDIIFMHKVIAGAADRSYGIHVARLAGLPSQVVRRAEDILSLLEMHGVCAAGVNEDLFSWQPQREASADEPEVVSKLSAVNVDDMTPKEALDTLYELKGLV